MQTIDQQRAAALARHAIYRAAEAERAAKAVKAAQLRADGLFQMLLVKAGMPLVRTGGGSLHELREDVFDAMNNANGRAGVHGIGAIYDSAMMGGEPFSVWN